jgi:hypothetical protein
MRRRLPRVFHSHTSKKSSRLVGKPEIVGAAARRTTLRTMCPYGRKAISYGKDKRVMGKLCPSYHDINSASDTLQSCLSSPSGFHFAAPERGHPAWNHGTSAPALSRERRQLCGRRGYSLWPWHPLRSRQGARVPLSFAPTSFRFQRARDEHRAQFLDNPVLATSR